MKRQPKVSVLIPIVNGQDMVDRCFESLVEQSTQNFDIVCIDDASTDETPKKLAFWKKKLGSRLRVVRNQENLGITKSLIRGMALISAPLTARLDVDDWWHKDKLAKQIAFMKKHPDYSVIGCNYINVSSVGERKVVLHETDAAIRSHMIRRNPFAHCCVMFRTDFIKKMGGYDETVRYGQDYELWLRIMNRTKFYNLSEFLCYRTVSPRVISATKQKEQMRQLIRTQARYIRKYRFPLSSYLVMVEPFMLIMLPEPLKVLKRKIFG